MSFLKSAINQVGRDMGKVVSNAVFKNSHATPYRRVNSNTSISSNYNYSGINKSEFDKAIEFQITFTPNTLINKVSGAYIVLKNQSKQYIEDGYLDVEESEQLFEMMNRLNQKLEDICDILEIDELANSNEIEKLKKIAENTNNVFRETLKISIQGCKTRQTELKEEVSKIKKPHFNKCIGLHLVWLGKYARGGEKVLYKSIIANIIDIMFLTFFFTRPFLFIKGVSFYNNEIKRIDRLQNTYNDLYDLEGKRVDIYSKLIVD